MSSIKNLVASKLNTLNSTYLNSTSSSFLGSSAKITSSFNGGDLTTTYINRTFNNILTAFEAGDTFATNAYNTSSTINVNVFNPSATPQNNPVVLGSFSSSSYNLINQANPLTTDINCIELMLSHGNGNQKIPKQLLCLQALYAWYSLFDSINWQIYTSGQSVTFNVPDIKTGNANVSTQFTQFKINKSGNGNIAVVTAGSPTQLVSQSLITDAGTTADVAPAKGTIVDLMNYYIPFSVFSESNFNPFVARRLIHLFIVLTHYNIVATYYNNQTTLPSSTPYLLDALYKLLQSLNLNVTDVNNGSFNQIVNAVQNRAAIYNNNQQQITELDSQISQLKTDISTDSNNLNSRLQYQSKSKKYQTAAIAMLLIIATGAVALFILPLEYKQKLTGGGTLIIIAVLTAIILQYQNSKLLLNEGFAVLDSSGMTSSLTFDASGWTNSVSKYYLQMMNEALTYLNNTFLLTTTLDSYHLYGNINYASSKELKFFGDAQTSLTMKDTNLKDVYNISYMDQVRFSALMNLAISLSLIIAVTVTLVLPLENYPDVRKAILIIAGLLAFSSITIYILEISSRVHTKPKQKYWGADVSALKSSN